MPQLILDSGGLSHLARRQSGSAGLIAAFQSNGLWPLTVPTVVLAESLTGRPRTDVPVSRLLKLCEVDDRVPRSAARRAGELRALAKRGSAVDAILVALAEPGGAVLTSDLVDMRALAAHADNVHVYRV